MGNYLKLGGEKMLIRESIQRMNTELWKYRNRESKEVTDLSFVTANSRERLEPGKYFGQKNSYYTLVSEVVIPKEWQGQPLAFEIFTTETEWDNTTNPQMKLYLEDELIQGIDVNHREVILPGKWLTKATLKFRLELFSGREEKKFPLIVRLNLLDEPTRQTYYDFYVALESWRAVLEETDSALIYQSALKNASQALNFSRPHSLTYYEGLETAREILETELYQRSDFTPPATVAAVGHTHIDIAWLWIVQQAIEKGERSFSTVLKMMEDYPDYAFIQSQPQMYQFLKEQYPELYQVIKEKIVEGRWEAEGAMWVEADCNLTSGESLVRQIMYGKKFIKEEFNKESQVLWLPDVFGYSAALPQILKKTNTPYFMTTKISWNQFNQIPYDTFYWKGIDGSEVLTHFITTISEAYSPTPYYTTYNGLLDPFSIKGSWKRYLQKDLNNEVLVAYGYGDGGGGPTTEMLETAKRLKNGLPGMPKVVSTSSQGFFQRLEETLAQKKVPRWMGELYFEYHRGTYTSMAKNKKNNRQVENLLQSLEKAYSLIDSTNYPQEEIERLWKLTLLNQFHDTLPGSSIKEVYDQTDLEYAETRSSIADLFRKLTNDDLAKENEQKLWLFNPLGIERKIVTKTALQRDQELRHKGQKLRRQLTADNQVLVEVPAVASLSSQLIDVVAGEELVAPISQELPLEVENPLYRLVFNEKYQLISVYDKENQRELVPAGEIFNQLNVYEDLPLNYDAWDIDIYYKEKSWPVEKLIQAKIIEDGPIRQTLLIERQYEESVIKQKIHLYHHTGRIDFETEVDWHQQHLLLKAEFPLEVHTYKGTFDIQFGNLERAIHENTSWDQARFEVSGQKWVDLSEGGYGISVITDSKYGFNVAYKKIGISLIKSATDPNPEADQGEHSFTYSIMPHAGTWQEGMTVEAALDLNVPAINQLLTVSEEQTEKLTRSLASCPEKNILLDTVKLAETGEGLILRAYEYHNKRTTACFQLGTTYEKAWLCDLLENELSELPLAADGKLLVEFAPYEIQTIKLLRKKED